MSALFEPVAFPRSTPMPNRFVLAPLTNSQSHTDGTLSEAERHWLVMRAEGGFGLTMTCAAHVQAVGQGFPGQLGIFGDQHIPGLRRLAGDINAAGSVSIVQLHHAGNRAPSELTGCVPVCPSDDPETGARALRTDEVEALVADFVAAAGRAAAAGFHGIEIHGAHGYIVCQFLSPDLNHRTDRYGGPLENRSRLLFEIIDGIRATCPPDFLVGVRLSPERFGMRLGEIKTVTQQLIDSGAVDFCDLSLWDCFKDPVEPEWTGRSLTEIVLDLERRRDPQGRVVPIGVAGKIHDPADAERVLAMGADFVVLGRVAILHHDYPHRLAADPGFVPNRPPVTRDDLRREGLSEPFIAYMSTWKGFVAD
jgi:2,4-dienoyl-CoA reductase-like NADH-dependent reductase (Old Yellow Enzyme family)